MEEAKVLYVLLFIFLLVLGLLWFLLPFAVFGIKPKMDALLQEAKTMNETLFDIRDALTRKTGDPR